MLRTVILNVPALETARVVDTLSALAVLQRTLVYINTRRVSILFDQLSAVPALALVSDVLIHAAAESAYAVPQHALVDFGDVSRLPAPAADAADAADATITTNPTASIVAFPIRWDDTTAAEVGPFS